MKKQYKRTQKITVLIAIIAIIASFIVVVIFLNHEKKLNIQHGEFVANSEANRIQYAIDSRLLNLEILEVLVIENGGMIENFEEIASMLYEQKAGIRCIQLAPNGIITHIYPLEGNENGFGNLFANPLRRKEAIHARDTGEMTLGGPYELHQGGVGVVARRPIYLEDSDGNKEFWGFSIQVMDLEPILQNAQLEQLNKDGYDYQLWRYMPDTNIKQVISGKNKISDDTLVDSIEVPGGEWYLEIVPKSGWVSIREIALSIALAVFVDILIIIISYYVLSSEDKKNKLSTIIRTDNLTGIYSSRHFFAILREFAEKKEAFALFYIDVDKFKEVNDKHGHNMGDKLLVEIGKRLKASLEGDCKAFRIGGDEFAVIMPGENEIIDCERMKNKLEDFCSRPITMNNITLDITVSSGYARYPEDSENLENLFNYADRQMYTDKMKKKTSGLELTE